MTARSPTGIRAAYDVVVVGAGSTGCVVASRLSEDPRRSVCLLEAGPDYGAYADGRWPRDLLYANELATSHDWGFEGGWAAWRAKVVGGCSAHNGCFVAWGAPGDFDGWGEAGNEGWSDAALEPYRRRALRMLRARPSRLEDLEPFMRDGLDAAAEIGLPPLEDFDDPGVLEGAAPILVNAVGDLRWNAAFAYLDPARDRPNLSIVAGTTADRLRFEGARATGVSVRIDGDEREVVADQVILAAGTYGSPAILLRSGIGPAAPLRSIGVRVRADLPGVGRNLTDHPRAELVYRPTPELLSRTRRHVARSPARAQTLIRARSATCPPGTWDIHLMMRLRRPIAPGPDADPDAMLAYLYVHVMKPASRGTVEIRSSDPDVLPAIDHGFLSDPEARDTATMAQGVELARRLAHTRALRGSLEEEISPGPTVDGDALEAHLTRSVGGYWHPTGTCKMGLPEDPDVVVDARGGVHGFANVSVVDASIMPSIPRANTQLPAMAIAERMSEMLSTE